MSAIKYKLWRSTDREPGELVGRGATKPAYVALSAVAKANSNDYPNVLINELICGQLAWVLRLPVPPGVIVDRDGEPHYVSLNFNLAGEDLPPYRPSEVIQAKPKLSVGIVLFDIWIANRDRNRGNLTHFKHTGQIHIFDHSHALLDQNDGCSRLDQVSNKLAIGNHPIAKALTSVSGITEWYAKIRAVPDYFVNAIVNDACQFGLSTDCAEETTAFLLERRNRLPEILQTNKGFFQNVQPGIWDQFAMDGGDK